MENWKQFRDTFYEVSDMGKVRTVPHNAFRSDGKSCFIKTRILKHAADKKGYLRVGLSVDGKLCTFKVHRIVAECFILNPDALPMVNHKNGNKADNTIENLEWCTNSQNIKHAFDTGLIKDIYKPVKDTSNFKRGVNNKTSKLNIETVKEARALRLSGLPYQTIADKFSVNKKTMMHAIKAVTWKHC